MSEKENCGGTWAENLRATVKVFHNHGLFHGNLRDTNFIIPKADDHYRI